MSLVALPASAGAWVEVDDTPYRGFVEIRVNASNRFTVVNVLNLEDYLKGVVPAELSPAVYPELEAIKAQAVAARTYAVRHRNQFAAEGFDICATPACQVYRGVSVEQRMGSEAVGATAGELLTYQGDPIDALYTSTCGGRTEDVQNVFSGEPQPYLVSRFCYAEAAPVNLRSDVALPLSQEAAGAVVLGVVTSEELVQVSVHEKATASELSLWASRAVGRLGQRQCGTLAGGGEPVSTLELARGLAQALCWEGRLPFLLSSQDTDHFVPQLEAPGVSLADRRVLAHWIEEGVIQPPREGLEPQRSLSRLELAESLYRLLASRGEPPLTAGRVLEIGHETLLLRVDEVEELHRLAPHRYLFRRVGESTYYSPSLSVLPDDRVSFHLGEDGIDLLVLHSRGASFDRSSRFSRWVVRKTSEELTAGVNAEVQIGTVTDLRPVRYGRSGRVAELEVVGTDGTVTLKGLSIRRRLGIHENLFFVDRQTSTDGSITGWVFTGRGWGHGVGLCQVGAYGMAAAGWSYREILSHYYPGTVVGELSQLSTSQVRTGKQVHGQGRKP